ncbi:SAM-dependent chlorinase/fluorinase [Candidatus Aerophobetes bacterium]|nr:SAM-dependent chlorinase/fluorinase [Candidatus Aerophobetes bacterium]
METPIITLTTDFATDLYVGQMKGVILSINPLAKLIDLTHKIKSYSVIEAAFFIGQVCKTFPEGTVHTVVVDPGVGSGRGAVILSTEKYFYVGPDNGVFHFVIQNEKIEKVFQIDEKLFKDAAPTFHGRDIFAPVAAFLSKGEKPEKFGSQIEKERLKKISLPSECILYIDEFGNIITNIRKEFPLGEKLIVEYKGKKIKATFARTFSDVKEGEYVVLKGSSGYLEVDRNRTSAAESLDASVGEKIRIRRIS